MITWPLRGHRRTSRRSRTSTCWSRTRLSAAAPQQPARRPATGQATARMPRLSRRTWRQPVRARAPCAPVPPASEEWRGLTKVESTAVFLDRERLHCERHCERLQSAAPHSRKTGACRQPRWAGPAGARRRGRARQRRAPSAAPRGRQTGARQRGTWARPPTRPAPRRAPRATGRAQPCGHDAGQAAVATPEVRDERTVVLSDRTAVADRAPALLGSALHHEWKPSGAGGAITAGCWCCPRTRESTTSTRWRTASVMEGRPTRALQGTVPARCAGGVLGCRQHAHHAALPRSRQKNEKTLPCVIRN